MPGRNSSYNGPEIMVRLMRTTDIPWQQRSIRNGVLISHAQYRERYQPAGRGTTAFEDLHAPVKAETRQFLTQPTYIADYDRELRNLHSQNSGENHQGYESPNSIYVSMTSSMADTSWGLNTTPPVIFRFNIWRSDVWKGKHDLKRDPLLQAWLSYHILKLPQDKVGEFLDSQTPDDWDRGAEFEWLAEGGTKIYDVEESNDGTNWHASVPTNNDVDFWWEALT